MPNAEKLHQGLSVLVAYGYTKEWPSSSEGVFWFAGPKPEHLSQEDFDVLYRCEFVYDIERGLWYCHGSMASILGKLF